MNILLNSLILIIAVMHLNFLVLEMFLWTKPIGIKVFRQSIEKAKESAVLAANQGLYNGFLSAGLFWSVFSNSPEVAFQAKVFFLFCVLVAGLYGGYSVNKRIAYIQALPAAVAIGILFGF